MRPVDAYWGHFSAKSLEISTNRSERSESSRQPACPRPSLPLPTLRERRHRGLARRLKPATLRQLGEGFLGGVKSRPGGRASGRGELRSVRTAHGDIHIEEWS
jgi:hypothetical protein